MTTDTVLTQEQIDALFNECMFGPDPQPVFARAIEQAVLQSPEVQRLREDADKYQVLRMAMPGIVEAKVQEALEAQAHYGYHIVSEVSGNGIAFCPREHPEAITEFMKANPGTTIRAVALIPQQ